MKTSLKIAAGVAVVAAAAVAVPLSVSAWGPVRESFTMQNPANYVAFNSIVDNPDYGDEHNFLGICEYDTARQKSICQDGNPMWGDEVKVENGKEYIVRLYVHNNAADHLGLVANNVRALVEMPSGKGKTFTLDSYLSWNSDGTHVNKIWDQVLLRGDNLFSLSLVNGTTKFTGNAFLDGVNLGDTILTSGVKVSDGYNHNGVIDRVLDGQVHGCFKYSGWVTFRVKASVDVDSNITLNKEVQVDGDSEWSEAVRATAGKQVNYRVRFQNVGQGRLNDVILRDVMPAGLRYIPGTTELFNGSNPNGMKMHDTLFTENGMNIGNYEAGAGAWIYFSAEVVGESELSCGEVILRNIIQAKGGDSAIDDTADVVVKRVCEDTTPPEEPKDGSTPPKSLPKTGPESAIAGVVGLGSIGAATSYYVASRRKLS